MPDLSEQLQLSRCPHCQVDTPSLHRQAILQTTNHLGADKRFWKVYSCARCGGAILASAENDGAPIKELYPPALEVDAAIPTPAREYLQQAIDSLHAPAGSVMLCASAVDAMLKALALKKGTLNERIDKAAEQHLITPEMAVWAHEVRLDANDPRHADEANPVPTDQDARKAVEFGLALGEFLFVLPSKVRRGLEMAKQQPSAG